jgi:hypothetical protein
MPCVVTVPLMPYVPAGFESLIVPLSRERVCVHLSVNFPEKAPLYDPDHVPPSFGVERMAPPAVDAKQQTATRAATQSVTPRLPRRDRAPCMRFPFSR